MHIHINEYIHTLKHKQITIYLCVIIYIYIYTYICKTNHNINNDNSYYIAVTINVHQAPGVQVRASDDRARCRDIGFSPLVIKNLLESSPLKSRFLVCELTVRTPS